MASLACLVFIESSGRYNAYIINLNDERDSATFIKEVGDIYWQNYNKYERFIKKHVTFRKSVVMEATLRQVTVDNLEAMPPLEAITQSTLPVRALSRALIDPDSMDLVFYRNVLELHRDIFMEAPEAGSSITLPVKALVIREETDPRAKRVLKGILSIVGGSLLLGLRIAGVE